LFVPEDPGDKRLEFDCTVWPVSPALQLAFATALANVRLDPARHAEGTRRSVSGAGLFFFR
jgi:hypothetical protein